MPQQACPSCRGYAEARTDELARESVRTDPMVSSDAITRDYMSIILVTQYGLMLNRSGDVARVQDEMSRVWLAGVRTRKNKNVVFIS